MKWEQIPMQCRGALTYHHSNRNALCSGAVTATMGASPALLRDKIQGQQQQKCPMQWYSYSNVELSPAPLMDNIDNAQSTTGSTVTAIVEASWGFSCAASAQNKTDKPKMLY
jgi:hypothetical protein